VLSDLHLPETAAIAAIGKRLRDAGLTARALAAWAGTARLAALPARLDGCAAAPATPAAAILALFVAGAEVARGQLRTLPDEAIERLVAAALIERRGDQLRAPLAVLPLGASLLVCDRLDAPVERDLACWPDDSSHHLATAIPPGRRGTWCDLGCGSAFAALARPDLAERIHGVDLNPRAVRFAQLGAALSGIPQLAASVGDIGDAHAPADLVTCNAPMPAVSESALRSGAAPRRGTAPPAATARRDAGPPGDRLGGLMPEIWRRADADFFSKLWPALERTVRPGGSIIVHGACEAIVPALADAPGERVIVTYTPDGVPGFAVAWWRPDGPARLATARRTLTPDRPHLDPRDRVDALANVGDPTA
jgi:methylase of polypeptide subunit release factors